MHLRLLPLVGAALVLSCEVEMPVEPTEGEETALLLHRSGRPMEVTIDFESIPGVGPACYFCAITDQFSGYGVEFTPFVYMTVVTNYEAPEVTSNYALTPNIIAANPIHVFDAVFNEYPFRVDFEITSGDDAPPWVIIATDRDGNEAPVSRTATTYVTRYGFLFRREYLTVESENGIAKINFDMSSATTYGYYLDNLTIKQRVSATKPKKQKRERGRRSGHRR